MIRKYFRLFLVLNILCVLCANAQEKNSASNINEGEELFKSGKYDEALQVLEPILLKDSLSKYKYLFNFNKREYEKLYAITTQIYLEKKNERMADNYMLKLLKHSPNFNPGQFYQADFNAVFSSYAVTPRVSIGVKAALNLLLFKTGKIYEVFDSVYYDSPYSSDVGYTYTGYMEYEPFKGYSISASYSYNKFSYNRKLEGYGTDNFKLYYSELNYNNEFTGILKKYFYKNNKIRPFAGLGINHSQMRQSLSSLSLYYTYRNNQFVENIKLDYSNVETAELRNANRTGFIGLAGLGYRTNDIVISADVRVLYENINFVNPLSRYQNNDFVYKFYYIDNDLFLRRLDFGIAIAYVLNYTVTRKFYER